MSRGQHECKPFFCCLLYAICKGWYSSRFAALVGVFNFRRDKFFFHLNLWHLPGHQLSMKWSVTFPIDLWLEWLLSSSFFFFLFCKGKMSRFICITVLVDGKGLAWIVETKNIRSACELKWPCMSSSRIASTVLFYARKEEESYFTSMVINEASMNWKFFQENESCCQIMGKRQRIFY